MIAMLRHVVEHGGPAQSAMAARLIEALRQQPEDPEGRSAAKLLIEGFLHDPHLAR